MSTTVTLSAGSIAFVGFQADSLDGFSFALLHDVKAGTVLYFTDNGFKTDGSGFKTDESLVRWTASQSYAAGSIISFVADGEDTAPEFDFINPIDGSVMDANSGTFGLSSSSGDSIIAFQNPTFGGANALQTESVIAGIHFGATSWATTYDDTGATNDSGLPSGPMALTPGTYSAVFGNVDNGRISDSALATLTGNEDAETLRNFFNDTANWETSDSRFSPPAPSGPITFNYTTVGTAADDTLTGNSGAERLFGFAGDDILIGNDGRDRLYGGDGDDTLRPGNGADILYGGAGIDTVDYSGAAAGVRVYMDSRQAFGADRLRQELHEMENVIATDHDDRVHGNDLDNVIMVGDGADIVYGGGGSDTISYADASAGVHVNLAYNFARDATGTTDYIHEVENITGSAFDDRIYGDDGDNIIAVGDGADIVYGRGGFDTISYADASAGVSVNLAYNFARDATGTTDYIHEIENVIGSAFADHLYGDDGDNVFTPGDGRDHIGGRGGIDTLSYADASASVHVELDKGFAIDAGGDTNYLYSLENLILSAFDDRAYGSDDVNVMHGGAGDDIIYARDGDDTIIGGLGNDRIIGENGADTLTGGAGADEFYLRGTEIGGADTITDFERGVDEIRLLQGGFGTYLEGDVADVFTGTGTSDDIFGAHTAQGFAYDTSNGNLYFDVDGAGGAGAQLIMTLTAIATIDSSDLVFYIG